MVAQNIYLKKKIFECPQSINFIQKQATRLGLNVYNFNNFNLRILMLQNQLKIINPYFRFDKNKKVIIDQRLKKRAKIRNIT